ncbi:lipoate--protein ligase family protein [Brevibacillus migulae]|uniref:lipoate--protein ligase family protein n=1 Tax=Brevibacillus migulae TaxID=1644114 RepID=UPI00106EF6AC|nr:biotin--protein ligase [Brevibacillus migulae]
MDGVSLPVRLGLIDTTSHCMSGDILFPFAFDEVIGKQVGEEQLEPIVHMWRHQRAFVLGARDYKLPNAQAAINWLRGQGYAVAVRNSGGAAVPLNPGVVNLSLILPNRQGSLDVQRHFEMMAALIRKSLWSCSRRIETGEVHGSYCPGTFDVSIEGKKFCGIAQRRQTRAVIVQAFVLIEGSGAERGRLVKEFYDIAAQGSAQADYPRVEPASMASLSELVGGGSVESFVASIKQQLGIARDLTGYQDYSSFNLERMEKTLADYRMRYPMNVSC